MRSDTDPTRCALVTGSTQGLGRAMAEALLEQGMRVAITGREQDRAEAVAHELDPSAELAIGLGLDVQSRASFTAAVANVEQQLGPIDALVNNAGTTVSSNFWEIEDDEWDRVLAVNLRSVLIGCQLVGHGMAERGWGRIINHASLAGQQGGAVAGAHYAASKAGIIVLTKIVAKELASSGVTVNAIAPAAVSSPPMAELSEERIRALEAAIPVGRVGRPQEVAALVAFLTSEAAGFITGATYDVNGGMFMR